MDCVVVYKMEGNVSYSLYSLNLFMIFYVKKIKYFMFKWSINYMGYFMIF